MSDDLSGFSLMDLFRMEAEGHTATLSTGLVALEGASAGPESIEPLMRAAHSLKGAARIVGLDAAVRVAHAMEDVFVAAQKSGLTLGTAAVDILLRGVDFLSQVAGVAEERCRPGRTIMPARLTPWWPTSARSRRAAPSRLSSPPRPRRPRWCPSRHPPRRHPNPLPPPAAPKPEPDREPEAPRDHDQDRVVRVTAESLTRLLGLAGESLVQSHRLRPVVDGLWRLRERQSRLMESLQVLEDRLSIAGIGAGGIGAGASLSAVPFSISAAGRELLARRAGAGRERFRRCRRRSRRWRRSRATARTSPAGCTTRCWPAGCGRWPTASADSPGWSATSPASWARRRSSRSSARRRASIATSSTGWRRRLNHLIRNALDHGLEVPDARRAAGKPAAGTIRLEARHRAGMLQLVLSDDGRGIDLDRLRAKVVERGLAEPTMARRLGEAELLDFLFLPGFSTKDQVTAVSGRGVGLDVVHSMVQSVRGSIRIASRPGKGTRFILQLPITVSVIRALLVEIAGEPYAFPLSRIDRILRVPPDEIRDLEGKPHLLLDDQLVGLVEATRVLELEGVGTSTAARPATRCRWWSPATAATASAWWSTAFWESGTSASRRSTPGWARCRTSAARRCWRTAGRS